MSWLFWRKGEERLPDRILRRFAAVEGCLAAHEELMSHIIWSASDKKQLQIAASLKHAVANEIRKQEPTWMEDERHKQIYRNAISATLMDFIEMVNDGPPEISN